MYVVGIQHTYTFMCTCIKESSVVGVVNTMTLLSNLFSKNVSVDGVYVCTKGFRCTKCVCFFVFVRNASYFNVAKKVTHTHTVQKDLREHMQEESKCKIYNNI